MGITRRDGETEKKLVDSGLTDLVIGKAIIVHSTLGPGLLESVYEACLTYELIEAGLQVERQKVLPVRYKNVSLDDGLRMDMVVENRIVLELKCVDTILPVHEAQLQTYLKLSGLRVGLLLNFYTKYLKEGIRRIIF
ncbi:GxxExxY protein [Geobacter sp.]|uniref:GxxExxY protein n=1 Tax=Geobacter sp. TaxID=46610 RepID=UPI0027B98078|nr:GxxExxY protein [Geobacter sp.]